MARIVSSRHQTLPKLLSPESLSCVLLLLMAEIESRPETFLLSNSFGHLAVGLVERTLDFFVVPLGQTIFELSIFGQALGWLGCCHDRT